MTLTYALAVALCVVCIPANASTTRLSLNFLPPDFPPGDICKVEIERFDKAETQVAFEGDEVVLDDTARLRFLASDIRSLRRLDPVRSFDFIMALIDYRSQIDERYVGFEATFDRIETYLAANRLEELRDEGLIETLTAKVDELGWTQTVRLSRYYLNGVGIEQDRDFAMRLILDQAYLGNANALLEVLRMQLRGADVGDWGLTPPETAELAFGGMVGRPNRGLCNRAERMAREYVDGDILVPNPNLAFAWRRFAADMGGADAAWRVVEHYLSVPEAQRNDAELRHYLQIAVANGAVILPETVDELFEEGATTESEVRRILGENTARMGHAERRSAVPYLDLDVRLTSLRVAENGEYLQYLREIAELPNVPGSVLTRLAKEILLRKGRWQGLEEARPLLENAAALGDSEAHRLLAEILLSEGGSDRAHDVAAQLLIDATERYGDPEGMKALDKLYRCQVPDAPRIHEAGFWAQAYKASTYEPVSISSTDLARLDPRREGEVIAHIQSLAVQGHGGSAADWLQYLQSDISTPDETLRYWANRVSASDVALEDFVLHEFELALTVGEREAALELFRRAYLDNGSSISLDLSLALIEHAGRDPIVAEAIIDLLESSANRGEGAAIRLLHRLTGRDAAEVYAEFADVIAARGDFISLVFASAFVDDRTFEDFMRRAIALMACNTKDIAEVTEAYSARGLESEVARWVRIGRALEGGNSMMRQGLSLQQISDFNRGTSITEDMLDSATSELSLTETHKRQYLRVSDSKNSDFDPKAAAENLIAIFASGIRADYLWALDRYRKADPSVRLALDTRIDIRSGLMSAAETGDSEAQYFLGMLSRESATNHKDLKRSTEWLAKAAQAGHAVAIIEYARAIGFGIGRNADPKTALIWLDRAERIASGSTDDLRNLFSAMVSE